MIVMHQLATLATVLAMALGACSPQGTQAPPPQASRGCGSDPAPTLPPLASAGCLPEPSPATSPAGSASAVETAPDGPGPIEQSVFRVPSGAHPHDVAPASDGGIWYTGQQNGTLGWLDPATGDVREARLPTGAAPHGVVTGPDGAAWVTDQGLDAIIRVTPGEFNVNVFEAPAGTAPHTPVFDHDGTLWFTGASGFLGRLDPADGEVQRYPTPRGAGPYGIAVTPTNDVWFVSLEKSYLGKVDKATGAVTVVEPPTANAGTRRLWADSNGRLWISYWNAGMIAFYDPSTERWGEYDLPGQGNQAYSMYVDETDAVWASDFGQNSVVRFDPLTETFESFPSERANAAVRQMLGRPGEAWGAESGADRLVVFRYGGG